MAILYRRVFFWSLFILIVLAIAMYSAVETGLVGLVRSHIRSDLLAANAVLKAENEKLKEDMERLVKQNQRLKKDLAGRIVQFSMLGDIAREPRQSDLTRPQDLQERLGNESFLNQQIYRALLAEKKRWDTYQQAQYLDILEGTLEPVIVDSQYLIFQDKDSQDAFLELENTLNLHKRLVRDVRLFHDEVRYRQRQIQEDPSYQLYDIKFNLEPFSRESAMTDALQQAMSAVGVGIYPQEAAQVLDRLGEAFIEPIEELSDWLEDPAAPSGPGPYNYNFYIVFGKKLINYADTLARQSLVSLAPSAIGELDFFSRRMTQSLVRLYEAGGRGNIDSTLLDMEALEAEEL